MTTKARLAVLLAILLAGLGILYVVLTPPVVPGDGASCNEGQGPNSQEGC